MDGFSVSSERQGSTVQVTMSGDLDAYHGDELREHLRDHLEDGVESVVVEASQVSFIDSGGLRVLLEADLGLRARGGAMTLHSPSPNVLAVLEMTDLTEHFGLR